MTGSLSSVAMARTIPPFAVPSSLVRRAGDEFFRGAAHLIELLHEIGLGVEASGSVYD